MKTTVNLPDELLREAQEIARRDQTTLKALIEAGLRIVLKQHTVDAKFVLTDASVGGRGLSQEFRGASWETFREAAYDSRP